MKSQFQPDFTENRNFKVKLWSPVKLNFWFLLNDLLVFLWSWTVCVVNINKFEYFSGQSLLTYFLLGVIYSTLWCCHRFRKQPSGGFGDTNLYKPASMSEVIKRRGIRYFFLAVSDVQVQIFDFKWLLELQYRYIWHQSLIKFKLIIILLQ